MTVVEWSVYHSAVIGPDAARRFHTEDPCSAVAANGDRWEGTIRPMPVAVVES